MSTYTRGEIVHNQYIGPVFSLRITDENNQNLTNTIQYDYDTTPYSITGIFFQICKNKTCPLTTPTFTFTIWSLKSSFIPSNPSTDIIKVTTLDGSPITQISVDTQKFSTIVPSFYLEVEADNPITNSLSNYTLSFTLPKIAIDSPLTLTLPPSLSASNCQLSVLPSILISSNCQVEGNVVKFEFVGDMNLIPFIDVVWNVRLGDVNTPVSTKPLLYEVSASFMGKRNIRASSMFAL